MLHLETFISESLLNNVSELPMIISATANMGSGNIIAHTTSYVTSTIGNQNNTTQIFYLVYLNGAEYLLGFFINTEDDKHRIVFGVVYTSISSTTNIISQFLPAMLDCSILIPNN